MGDVADILGLGGPSTSGRASPLLGGPLGLVEGNKRGKGGAAPQKKTGKPQGVSREVYALLGSEGLPPEVRKVVCECLLRGVEAFSIAVVQLSKCRSMTVDV